MFIEWRLAIGRKSTDRKTPSNLNEQLALKSPIAGSDYGRILFQITDPTWSEPGWYKMVFNYPLSNELAIEVHHNRNIYNCNVDDLKLKIQV